MNVRGLNHVNIVTADLESTTAFYEKVLGLRAQENPVSMAGFKGCWLCDEEGNAVIHLQAFNPDRHAPPEGTTTGAIDHVALTCYGFASMVNHCQDLGVKAQVNDRKYGDLRQIFVTDPNNVKLELNFPGD